MLEHLARELLREGAPPPSSASSTTAGPFSHASRDLAEADGRRRRGAFGVASPVSALMRWRLAVLAVSLAGAAAARRMEGRVARALSAALLAVAASEVALGVAWHAVWAKA